MKRRLILSLLLAILRAPAGICSQPDANFSGTWNLNGERSVPPRTGNVTLHIDQHDPELTVKTTIVHGSAAPRQAVQRYATDGKTSITTGADGDEFNTSVVWDGGSLVFSVEEHEDGRVILSRERWTLVENGAALQRVREGFNASSHGAGKQTLIYLKEAPQT